MFVTLINKKYHVAAKRRFVRYSQQILILPPFFMAPTHFSATVPAVCTGLCCCCGCRCCCCLLLYCIKVKERWVNVCVRSSCLLGSSVQRGTAQPAVNWSQPLKWWWEPEIMFTIWTVLPVSFATRGKNEGSTQHTTTSAFQKNMSRVSESPVA